jgi:hypothetical protein
VPSAAIAPIAVPEAGIAAPSRQLFAGLDDSIWSVGLVEEETARDPAGEIYRIARSVNDGQVRPDGAELLGYVSQPLKGPASWMSVKTTSTRCPACRWPEEHPIRRCAILARPGSAESSRLRPRVQPAMSRCSSRPVPPRIRGWTAPVTARCGTLIQCPHNVSTCAMVRCSTRNVQNRTNMDTHHLNFQSAGAPLLTAHSLQQGLHHAAGLDLSAPTIMSGLPR